MGREGEREREREADSGDPSDLCRSSITVLAPRYRGYPGSRLSLPTAVYFATAVASLRNPIQAGNKFAVSSLAKGDRNSSRD